MDMLGMYIWVFRGPLATSIISFMSFRLFQLELGLHAKIADGSQTGPRRVPDGPQTGPRRVPDGSQTGPLHVAP